MCLPSLFVEEMKSDVGRYNTFFGCEKTRSEFPKVTS
jgi:hypothetical protein